VYVLCDAHGGKTENSPGKTKYSPRKTCFCFTQRQKDRAFLRRVFPDSHFFGNRGTGRDMPTERTKYKEKIKLEGYPVEPREKRPMGTPESCAKAKSGAFLASVIAVQAGFGGSTKRLTKAWHTNFTA
jgi:hypothetical protein